MIESPGVIDEIDKSKFRKRKCNKNERVKGTRTFGGIERSTDRWFFEVMEDKFRETLL